MKLSVIIPVYNEKKTIRELLKRVETVSMEKQIIIVDDFSTDGTRDILSGMREELEAKGHKLVFQEKNLGKGAAVHAAQAHVDGDLVLIQDADLEYDPNDYHKLIQPILEDKADVVYGSRFLGGGHRVLYYWHTIGNRILTFVSNIFTNLNLTDMETCYKVFRSDIFKMIPIRSRRFGIEPEITAKVAKMGTRIYEVPISYNGRTYLEGKKIGWRDGVSAIWTIMKYVFIDDAEGEDSGYKTLLAMSKTESYNKYLFDFIAPYLGKSVLEVGSGIGNMSRFIVAQADRTLLTEIEARYFLRLRNAYRHTPYVEVYKCPAEDLHQVVRERVDSVVCLNVLEHIEKQEDALKSFHSILSSDGTLVLIVPSHQWAYGATDAAIGHYRRYSRSSLNEVLVKNNFKPVTMRHINAVGVPGWIVNGRILNKKTVSIWQIKLMGLLLPWLHLEKKFDIPFGLSLLVVAKKKC